MTTSNENPVIQLTKEERFDLRRKLDKKKYFKFNMTLLFMLVLAALACCYFTFADFNESSEKVKAFLLKARVPRVYAMIIAGSCIGFATIAFQSVIRNPIISPDLLGMSSLYSLVQTSLYYFLQGETIFIYNRNINFLLNLFIMCIVSLILYGYLFKKTDYNVLYVLLIGSVFSSFIGSFTSTMTRLMDPNTYDSLLDNIVASFGRVNGDILVLSLVVIIINLIVFWRDLRLLDVITLGKQQAINLGVDYDKVISRILLSVIIFVSVATALVGPISFLGIIVSNISRQIFKTYRHSYLLASSAVVSVIVLAGGQAFIEQILPFTTYISVVVSIFGGSYFLFLIIKNKGA